MKKILTITSLALLTLTNAQNSKTTLILEEKLGKFDSYNKYNINDFTKTLLEKEGFDVYDSNNLPVELSNNRCDAHYVNYIDDSGMFTTGLKMIIKDCTGKIVYESELGKSREKEYRVAYREAFRNVAKDFLQKKNTITFTTFDLVNKDSEKNTKSTNPITQNTHLIFDFKENSLQGELKNTENTVLYKLTKTSVDNLYMASNPYVDGIVYLKDGKWYFEFTKNGEKIVEEIK
jgi:hypothetical protein